MWNRFSPIFSWWDQNLENAQSPHVFLIISNRFVYVSTRDPVESYRLDMTGWSWIIGRLDFALRGKLFEEHRECNERGGKFCFKIFEGTGPQGQVTIISHFPHKNAFSLRGNFCLMAFVESINIYFGLLQLVKMIKFLAQVNKWGFQKKPNLSKKIIPRVFQGYISRTKGESRGGFHESTWNYIDVFKK